MKKGLNTIFIFCISIFILVLFLESKLTFYVDERYIWFTFGAAVLALLFSLLGGYAYFKEYGFFAIKKCLPGLTLTELQISVFLFLIGFAFPPALILLIIYLFLTPKISLLTGRIISFDFVILIFISLIFIIPAQPLTSASFDIRNTDLNSANFSYRADEILFTSDSTSFTVADWVTAFNLNEDQDQFIGKKAVLEGFVYAEESWDENHFMLSRFIITCCAVDAQPVGVYVLYDWKPRFAKDEWVRVNGSWDIIEIDGLRTLTLIPEEIENIPIPSNPYL